MPKTYANSVVGKREDLADQIYNIDAKKTPLLSMIPKGKEPTNPASRWQADRYDDPRTDGVVDGQDADTTEDASEYRVELEGRVQKLWRLPMVSDLAENVTDVAGIGRKRLYAQAVVKKTAELKRDVECVLGSDNESQDDNGSVPYKTRGLGKWISSSAQTHEPVDSNYRTPSASIDSTALASLTPDIVNTVMESQYGVVGEELRMALVCGTKLKKRFTSMVGYQPTVASFTAILQSQRGSEGAWANNIEAFTGDFGTYELILSNWLNFNNSTQAIDQRRGYALDTKMLELRFNRQWRHKPLNDNGGGPRGLIDVILMLCVKNPKGLAKFAATADS